MSDKVKTCRKCGIQRSGAACAPCYAEWKREWRRKNPPEERVQNVHARAEARAEARRLSASKACEKCGAMRAYGRPCAECVRAWRTNRSEEQKEKKRAKNRAWGATNKDRISRERKEKYRENPELTKARSREWVRNNVTRHKAATAEYRAKNREAIALTKSKTSNIYLQQRRARKRNAAGSHTAAEWTLIVTRQKGRCLHCKSKTKLSKDHIVPLSKGGTNFAFNLQGLCVSCNSKKHARIDPGTQHSLFDKTVAA